MQLKLFLLPVKNLAAAEAEMNAFLRSHRMLAVKKEFVSDGENSFWTFCMEYLESAPAMPAPSLPGRPKVDYKEVLKPDEFEIFSRLRDWRKTVAIPSCAGVAAQANSRNQRPVPVVWRSPAKTPGVSSGS